MYKIMDGNEACSYVSYKFTELSGIQVLKEMKVRIE